MPRTRVKAGGEAFKAAVAAAETVPPPTELEVRNGVRLKLKPVPPLTVRRAVAHLKRPIVPKADLGKGRVEDNPGDPEYVAAMEEYGQLAFDAGANVMLALGTEVLHVPDGLEPPESDGWVEQLTAAGFEVDLSTAPARRLSWLSFYAITSETDVVKIVLGVTQLTGTAESEVAAAVESFRSGAVRGSDNGVSAEAS